MNPSLLRGDRVEGEVGSEAIRGQLQSDEAEEDLD